MLCLVLCEEPDVGREHTYKSGNFSVLFAAHDCRDTLQAYTGDIQQSSLPSYRALRVDSIYFCEKCHSDPSFYYDFTDRR